MENKEAAERLKEYFGIVDEGAIVPEEDLEGLSVDILEEVNMNG